MQANVAPLSNDLQTTKWPRSNLNNLHFASILLRQFFDFRIRINRISFCRSHVIATYILFQEYSELFFFITLSRRNLEFSQCQYDR